MKCKGCGERPAAANCDYCLPCLNSRAIPATGTDDDTGPTVDEVVARSLATNAPGGPRLCVECGAAVRPINLFGGSSFYRCTNPSCLHEDVEAGDATQWPTLSVQEMQKHFPTVGSERN